jgi:hypothetical protein
MSEAARRQHGGCAAVRLSLEHAYFVKGGGQGAMLDLQPGVPLQPVSIVINDPDKAAIHFSFLAQRSSEASGSKELAAQQPIGGGVLRCDAAPIASLCWESRRSRKIYLGAGPGQDPDARTSMLLFYAVRVAYKPRPNAWDQRTPQSASAPGSDAGGARSGGGTGISGSGGAGAVLELQSQIGTALTRLYDFDTQLRCLKPGSLGPRPQDPASLTDDSGDRSSREGSELRNSAHRQAMSAAAALASRAATAAAAQHAALAGSSGGGDDSSQDGTDGMRAAARAAGELLACRQWADASVEARQLLKGMRDLPLLKLTLADKDSVDKDSAITALATSGMDGAAQAAGGAARRLRDALDAQLLASFRALAMMMAVQAAGVSSMRELEEVQRRVEGGKGALKTMAQAMRVSSSANAMAVGQVRPCAGTSAAACGGVQSDVRSHLLRPNKPGFLCWAISGSLIIEIKQERLHVIAFLSHPSYPCRGMCAAASAP